MALNLKMIEVLPTLIVCQTPITWEKSATVFMKSNTKNWPGIAPTDSFHQVLQSYFLAKLVNERATQAEIRMSKHFFIHAMDESASITKEKHSSSYTIYFIFDLKLTIQKPQSSQRTSVVKHNVYIEINKNITANQFLEAIIAQVTFNIQRILIPKDRLHTEMQYIFILSYCLASYKNSFRIPTL